MTSTEAAERLFLIRKYAQVNGQRFNTNNSQLAILSAFSLEAQGEIMAEVAKRELRDANGLAALHGRDEVTQ
jgi:hypothetical protein